MKCLLLKAHDWFWFHLWLLLIGWKSGGRTLNQSLSEVMYLVLRHVLGTLFRNQINWYQIVGLFLRRAWENQTTSRKTSRSRVENQQTQSTCDAKYQWESKLVCIDGRRALSPLRYPCFLAPCNFYFHCVQGWSRLFLFFMCMSVLCIRRWVSDFQFLIIRNFPGCSTRRSTPFEPDWRSEKRI